MRDRVKPISNDERLARIERARELMKANGIDAIVLASGTSLTYFSGIRWWPSERFFAMVIPARGNAFCVSPAFEEERAREQIAKGPLGGTADVRIWQEDEDPYERLVQGLKDHGASGGRLGIEETTWFVFSDNIARCAPGIQCVSATPVTAGCRTIKSPAELELMRVANEATLAAYEAARKAIRPGMTDRQFGSLIEAAHQRLGFPGDAMVLVDQYSASPHGTVNPQVIKENSIVLIDGGCKVEGYSSDISRTFVVGKPTDKMRRVFDIVHKAQEKALATARPKEKCGDVDAAARLVITDAGFGPDYKYFTHRVGHGIGMDGHEWPYLVRGNKLPLQPGMTFSDEPGIYIRGEFGVRLEDDMYITEGGAELFTGQSHSLEEPFQAL
ncbi:MAG: M24 family metallopeptidase [Acidobacteriaceae bacterium]